MGQVVEHVFRPLGCAYIVNAVGCVYALHSVVLLPLELDAMTMAHLDPIDIIASPFPLRSLCIFVSCSTVWTCLVFSIFKYATSPSAALPSAGKILRNVVRSAIDLVVGGGLIHIMILLCGMDPFESPVRTMVSSFYLATCLLCPLTLDEGLLRTLMESFGQDLKLSVGNGRENCVFPISKAGEGYEHILRKYSTLGCLIGIVPCALLRILDAGLQIQRWPVPILLGGTLGRFFGVLAAFGIILWESQKKDNGEVAIDGVISAENIKAVKDS